MAAFTPNLNLYLAGGGSLNIGGADEPADIDKLNQNFQAIDTFAGTVEQTVPAGTVAMFAGATAPDGWLLCNGQSVSRTGNAALFAAIGTAYGSANSTVFNLPNFLGRAPVGMDASQTEFNALNKTGGAKTHTLTANQSGLRAHSHPYVNGFRKDWAISIGQTGNGRGMDLGTSQSFSTSQVAAQNASESHNNLQPYLSLNFIIKK